MTASHSTSPPGRGTVGDFLLWLVRDGFSHAEAGSTLAFAISSGFIEVEPPIPPRARVRGMARNRFFIETADALIPAENFRYRSLRPQDYLRENYFTDHPYHLLQEPPDRPQPAKVMALPVKHGTKERSEWKEIVPHLKAQFDTGKLPSPNAAYHAISDWLAEKGITMAKSTIQNGIKRHCDWWK